MSEPIGNLMSGLVERGNYLNSNSILRPGEALTSKNGLFSAVLGADGRICIFINRPGIAQPDLYHCVMMTGWPEGDYYATLHINGNFCVYAGTGPTDNKGAVWSSNTPHDYESEYFAIMRNDGNFCIFAGKYPNEYRGMSWCTGTAATTLSREIEPAPGPQHGMLASTMDHPSRRSWAFNAGVRFVQQLRVQQSGTPTTLAIGMGSNQNPYQAQVSFMRGDELLFQRSYADRKQRSSDWTTVFELTGFDHELVAGEMISFEIIALDATSIEPVLDDLADYPRSMMPNYGLMAAKFMLEGSIVTPGAAVAVKQSGGLEKKSMLQLGENGFVPLGVEMIGVIEANFEVVAQTWDYGGNLILPWTQTQASGSMVQLPSPIINGRVSPSFFYPSRGVYSAKVTCDGWSNGRYVQVVSTSRPTTATAPANIETNGNTHPVTVRQRDGAGYHVDFGLAGGRTSQETPGVGIRFRATLSTMGTIGDIAAMQFVRGHRIYTKGDGSKFNLSTNLEWYLDRSLRDGNMQYQGPDATAEILPGGNANVFMFDRPSFSLNPNVVRTWVYETFRTYLVYKPKGPGVHSARWVPLGYVEWNWNVIISRASTSVPWPVTVDSVSYTDAGALSTFKEAKELPNWNHTTADLKAQVEAEFPATAPAFVEYNSGDVMNAEQIEISLSGTVTPEILNQLGTVLETPISNASRDAHSVLVWVSPAKAQRALQVPGVTSVAKVDISQRYTPDPSHAHQDEERTLVVSVAPYSWYYNIQGGREFANTFSPKSLAMVASDLVEQNRTKHPNIGLAARIFSETSLFLTFSVPLSESLIREIAEHAQVSFAERASHFRSDDPPVHLPDLM
jgi:hypothetical protein